MTDPQEWAHFLPGMIRHKGKYGESHVHYTQEGTIHAAKNAYFASDQAADLTRELHTLHKLYELSALGDVLASDKMPSAMERAVIYLIKTASMMGFDVSVSEYSTPQYAVLNGIQERVAADDKP